MQKIYMRPMGGIGVGVKLMMLVVVMGMGVKGWGQVAIPNTTAVTQNFDGIAATTTLPTNWRMAASTASPTWAAAATSLTQQASSGSPATGGTYNFGSSASERAVGAMTSGGFASPNNLLAFFQNTNASNLTSLTISYDAERYRINTAAASVQFFYSLNGTTWIAVTAGDIAAASFPTGASAYNFTTGTVINRTGISITGLNIATNDSFYLRWNVNTTGASSQGIAIDNVSVTAAFACTPPTDPSGTISGTTPACTSTSLTYSAPSTSSYWQTSATGTSTAQNTTTAYNVTTSGTYYVREYDGTCWSTNSVASTAITINTQPATPSAPADASVPLGSNTSFTSTATGAASYIWEVNTGSGYTTVANGGVYSDATTSTLNLTAVPLSYNGYLYRATAVGTAPCGSSSASLPATLSVTNASASNIVRSTGFTEPSNILYDLYQTTNIIPAHTNDIKIGEFTIQDGSGAADGDGVGTILNAITFTVANFANIRRLAIYDGATEVGTEQAGAASVSFTGLNLFTASGGSKTFSVYASFTTAVTDNQQVSLTVNSATANASGSGFTAANAGAAATSVIGDANRIEVIATRIVYVQGPTSVAVLTNMTPAITVAARDAIAFNNLDLDYVTSVSLAITTTLCGSLTGNVVTPVNGIATYSALQGTVAETGLTLTASSGSFANIISGTFNFTTASAVVTSLVSWNFADSNPTSDAPSIAANSAVTIGSSNAAGGVNYPQGQLASPDNCILNSDWSALGAWTTLNISTVGYSNITLSSVQRGSATGPRDWKVQYNVGSGWVDIVGATLTLTSGGWPRSPVAGEFLADFGLPAACSNVSNLQLRWIMTTTNSIGGGALGSGGTSALDQILVKGTTLNAAANLFYRTKATGNFETPCVWETSLTGANPWIQASTPPDFSARTITVANTHTITLNSAVTLDEFNIATGGNFILNNNTLTVNNGTGVDFLVDGTFTYNSISGNGFSFNTSSTWQLGTNGTLIKGGDASAASLRDFYEGGMSTMNSTANWILRYNGVNNYNLTTINSFYPNLTFEKATVGVYNSGIGTTRFSGLTSSAIIRGDLNIGGAGLGDVVVYNENTNSNALLVEGNLVINVGSTLTNLGTTPGTGFEVKGNITTNGTFTINGTNILPTDATGKLVLSGTGTQTISGTGTLNLEDVAINNTTASANLIINQSFDLPGTLSFGSSAARLTVGTGDIALKSSVLRTANVGNVLGTIAYSSTGLFNIERYLQSVKSWRLLATPIQSGTLSITDSWREGIAGATNTASTGYGTQITGPATSLNMDEITQRGSLKWYNKTANNYIEITNTFDAIARPQGYYVFVRGDRAQNVAGTGSATNLRMRGRILTGQQTFTALPPTGPTFTDGFESVGNPYPSQISYKTATKTDLEQSYTVWNPTGGFYGVGRFIQYTSTTGLNGDYSNGGSTVNEIESGQAFFIQSAVGVSGTLVINESDKLTGSNLVSRNGVANRTGVTVPTLEVTLRDANSNATQTYLDQITLNFDDSYSNDYDGNDVRKFMNSNDNIAVKRGTRNLILERRSTLQATDTIFLNLTNTRIAPYRFEIDPSVLSNLPLNAFLIDKFLVTETPVSLTAVTNVPFSITSNAASRVADRFMIVFRQAAAGPLPVNFTTIAAEKNADKTNTVNWSVANEINISNYHIERSANGTGFAAMGTTAATGNTGNNASYNFVDVAPLAGINFYRVKATSANGQVQYSAIVKLVYNEVKPQFAIQPNPVINKTLNINFDNMKGNYSVKLISKQGATVFSKQITVASANEVKNIAVTGVAAGLYEVIMVDAMGKQMLQSVVIQ